MIVLIKSRTFKKIRMMIEFNLMKVIKDNLIHKEISIQIIIYIRILLILRILFKIVFLIAVKSNKAVTMVRHKLVTLTLALPLIPLCFNLQLMRIKERHCYFMILMMVCTLKLTHLLLCSRIVFWEQIQLIKREQY